MSVGSLRDVVAKARAMKMRHPLPRPVRSGAAVLVAALALLGGPGAARGGEPWQGLPPTPALPRPLASGFASVNGIRMFYATFGGGHPLLLLHGGLASSNYWGAVIPILAGHHYEVIVA